VCVGDVDMQLHRIGVVLIPPLIFMLLRLYDNLLSPHMVLSVLPGKLPDTIDYQGMLVTTDAW
jgi:hypothetical protein